MGSDQGRPADTQATSRWLEYPARIGNYKKFDEVQQSVTIEGLTTRHRYNRTEGKMDRGGSQEVRPVRRNGSSLPCFSLA